VQRARQFPPQTLPAITVVARACQLAIARRDLESASAAAYAAAIQRSAATRHAADSDPSARSITCANPVVTVNPSHQQRGRPAPDPGHRRPGHARQDEWPAEPDNRVIAIDGSRQHPPLHRRGGDRP
jgi:hypothetical protein